jgi:hypothetical protein
VLHAIISTTTNGVLEYQSGGELQEKKILLDLDSRRLLTSGQITPFFPGCYPDDLMTHVLKITIVMDWSASGPNNRAALAALSNEVAFGKSVFIQQLNIRLEVKNVVIGKQGDPFPLGRGGSVCTSAIAQFRELGAWLRKNPQQSAFTLLVSNCYTGVTGNANLGSACGSSGYAVAQFNFLTMFHEFGHGIGMQHSFQNGIRFVFGLGNVEFQLTSL